ncbi:MAG: hypothetical protein RIG63_09710 [Coleofasciculus chthonoplastes F3-SA18-01]|uniref:Uncharacterized protein n=1 Tax=Coleofasciculus chthonoplastes PCC 7420 TaxID=118168 RepID=B4VUF8_9CYAN|nr:hypothetical protein MC7420_3904 [Coleofasciculus chthonoplastes PCC 7420]
MIQVLASSNLRRLGFAAILAFLCAIAPFVVGAVFAINACITPFNQKVDL